MTLKVIIEVFVLLVAAAPEMFPTAAPVSVDKRTHTHRGWRSGGADAGKRNVFWGSLKGSDAS